MRNKASYWVTMSAVGTMAAYGVLTGKAVQPLYSGPEERTLEAIHAGNWTQNVDVFNFDIPPALLDVVLEAFKKTTGFDVILSRPGMGSLPSPGIMGRHSADQALRSILAGTGVAFRYTSSSTVTLSLDTIEERVSVISPAPVVVPSSPKFTEPLRDIPQTISVIPEAVIQQQGATTLREVLRNVTGISIQAGEGGVPAGDNLSIRGFNARTDMFVDGVRDFGAYSRDPFNVEQVEVSKGPSSAYAGRGSTGGSINLSTKTPKLNSTRSATIAAGSSAYKRATVDINEPIGSLGAAFRFNGMFTDSGTPGRDEVDSRRWGLSPSLAFGLNGPSKLTLSYLHLDQDNLPEYGLPWVPSTNQVLTDYHDQAPPVSFSNFYGLRTRDYEKTFTRLGTAEFRQDFGSTVSIRSSVRHGRTKRDSVISAPRFASVTSTAINRQLQSRDQTDAITASQTNLTFLTSTGSISHSIIGGVEFARESSKNYGRTGPTAPTADLFNPDPNQPYAGPIVRTGALTESTADTAAVYAGDTIKFNEHWQATGSLRWDNFNLDYESTAISGTVTPFTRTDKMLSGRAGLVFKPQANGSVYFGYGTSLNPSAEGLSLTTATQDLKPEKSRSYEAGVKWDLYSNRLSVNSAYFRTEKTNARTPGINPGDPPTVLDGEQHVDGVEFGLLGNIAQRWQAIGGYTFMRSKISRSNNASEVGREFGNTPRHSFNIWTNYQLPWSVDLGGGATYLGSRLNSNTQSRVADAYTLVDLTAAYHVTERLTLRLNVTNLMNERYIDRIGGGHFIPGPGRLAMLTTDFRF